MLWSPLLFNLGPCHLSTAKCELWWTLFWRSRVLYRDSAVLTSLPSSTAESLGDLSQVVLFSVFVSFLPSLPTRDCTVFPKICSWCMSVCIDSYTSCIYLGAATSQLLPNNCRLLTLWYRTLEREHSPWPRRHCVLQRQEEGKGWGEVWGLTLHWVKLHPFLSVHSLFIFLKMWLLRQRNTYFSEEVLSNRVQCTQISSERGY